MHRVLVLLVLTVSVCKTGQADELWPLESLPSTPLKVRGDISLAKGVQGNSFVLDGRSLLTVEDSGNLATSEAGFTLMAWVNPHRLDGTQQMIAAKNRYSLNERQWSVMIDQDKRFRLYVYQGTWVTTDSPREPLPGRWHLIGVVVRPGTAELWVNGRLEGSIGLAKPIPKTTAPITFGGIDDNGRLRQHLAGALDHIRIFERPLSGPQMAAAYNMVSTTHAIAESPKPTQIWSGDRIPNTSEAEELEGVQFHVIKRYEPDIDGYGFLHGVALAWHKGKLYASFGHNQGSENTLTEEARYCVSEDGGKTWSPVQTIDVGTEKKDLAVSHGVFLSRNETLWAFLGSFYGTRERVHTRAYTLNENTGNWEPRGTVVANGFWPMTEPVKMKDGNWILPGFIVGNGNPAAVAISNGDQLTNWKLVTIPQASQLGTMWGESSIAVDGSHVTNIARYGDKALALVASSNDYGDTWTPSTESNLPMAASKPCAGLLSNGQRYLIGSTTSDGRNRRSPLTIAVSQPGEPTFSKLFVIRHAVFEDGPGESHPGAALSYPYAIEHNGQLYVGYSNNGPRRANNNSAELAIIPIKSLAVE